MEKGKTPLTECTVLFKNEKELVFAALEVEVTSNKITGAIEKIDVVGAGANRPLYINLDEVVAVYCNKI